MNFKVCIFRTGMNFYQNTKKVRIYIKWLLVFVLSNT